MKKFVCLIIIALLLSACSKNASDEIAMPYKEPDTQAVISDRSDDNTTQPPESENMHETNASDTAPDTDMQGTEFDNNTETNPAEDSGQNVIIQGSYVSTELDGMEISYYGTMNGPSFNSIEDLYEFADLVVATPENKYTESEQVWRDINNNTVDSLDAAQITHSYTKRKFKVNKVYKGDDLKLKEFYLYERAITDGNSARLINGEYVAEKGNKYLLFLYRSTNDIDLYLSLCYQGKYDTNSQNNEGNNQINQALFKQVKELYKEEFK